MVVKVTIEFTTDSYEYQVLKNDEFFEENYKDNDVVMDLVERLHNSTTYEERQEIAEELWEECGYDNAARMLGDGRLEVTYKKSDEEDIYVRSYEVLDNDWVDFDDYFEEDIKKSSFCIIKNSYAKRAHYYLETELDEPFSGEFLKIADGGISYKDEEMEFTGDAGGWIEESGIYVMGSSETEDDESDDEQVDIGEVRTSKLEELFADEIQEYKRRRKEIFDNQDAQLISLWKECNIPDNGEKSWEELLDEDEYTEIVEDVREECGKFGTVTDIVVPRPNTKDGGVGKIYVQYETAAMAVNARGTLNGRKFAERVVGTYFLEENKFAAKIYE